MVAPRFAGVRPNPDGGCCRGRTRCGRSRGSCSGQWLCPGAPFPDCGPIMNAEKIRVLEPWYMVHASCLVQESPTVRSLSASRRDLRRAVGRTSNPDPKEPTHTKRNVSHGRRHHFSSGHHHGGGHPAQEDEGTVRALLRRPHASRLLDRHGRVRASRPTAPRSFRRASPARASSASTSSSASRR